VIPIRFPGKSVADQYLFKQWEWKQDNVYSKNGKYKIPKKTRGGKIIAVKNINFWREKQQMMHINK